MTAEWQKGWTVDILGVGDGRWEQEGAGGRQSQRQRVL